jgi:hypothetical protein
LYKINCEQTSQNNKNKYKITNSMKKLIKLATFIRTQLQKIFYQIRRIKRVNIEPSEPRKQVVRNSHGFPTILK